MNASYDTYIFDYYGTLLDSYNDEKSLIYWERWLSVLDDMGIKHPEAKVFLKEFFDMDKAYRIKITKDRGFKYPEVNIIDVYRDILDGYGNGILSNTILNEVAYAFREATREYIKLYPGVTEYLVRLKKLGKKVYILSNAQRSYTYPEITMFGVDKLVDGIMISSDIGCMKPETYLYEQLFSRFNISKEKAVMIGDSLESDVAGAKSFGIDYIHLVGANKAELFFTKELEE